MSDEKKRKTQENSQAQEDDSPVVDKQQLQARILGGIKPNVGEMTGKWVVDLSEGGDGEVSVPTAFDEHKAEKFPDDMRSWVDRIFDDFQRYIYEYNKAVDQQELLINSERPNFVKDSTAGLLKYRAQQVGQPQALVFQGHLYTRHWALLVRGEEANVKAYALPVDFLIAFDSRQDEFKPYFEMRGAKNKKGMMIWHVDAVPISFEALGAVSKALFGALVKASRNELSDKERFKLASAQREDLETTDTEAFVRRYTIPPGAKQMMVSDVVQQLQSPFARLAQPMAGAPQAPPSPARPAGPVMTGPPPQPTPSGLAGQASAPGNAQNPPAGADSFQRQFGQAPISQYQQQQLAPVPQPLPQPLSQPLPQPPQMPAQPPFGLPPQQPQPVARQPQQLAPQPTFAAPQPQQITPQQQQYQPPLQPSPQPAAPAQSQQGLQAQSQAEGDEINTRLNENRAAVLAALQQANLSLHAQMDALTKIGVTSLHQQSMEGVMQVMKRTNSLKALKERLEAVIQEWNNIQASK